MKRSGTELHLDELASPRSAEDPLPITISGLVLKDPPPPRATENLAKLAKLRILNGDTVMSLIAQAPIDPVNLVGTLMGLTPDGWVFSAIDFSMMRVLKRDDTGVRAALSVDLMGDAIRFLARNQKHQLVVYKTLTVVPSPTTWDEVQKLTYETIVAGDREAAP